MKVEILEHTNEPEKLIELAGRTCYKSESEITNRSSSEFVRKIIKNGHESVLEHAYVTFRVKGASRSFTHQLVRHRLCSFSQESQRYVNQDKWTLIDPPSIYNNKEALDTYLKCMRRVAWTYSRLIHMGIPKEDARFVLPNGCGTEIVFSCNFRQLRSILKLRTNKRSQWEIRGVFNEILKLMMEVAPNCFVDISVSG